MSRMKSTSRQISSGSRFGPPPGRHPRQLHAVLNDVVNFAITEGLGFRAMKVRLTGIQVPTHWRFPGPVNTMATCTTRQKQFPSVFEVLCRCLQRIFLAPRATWNRQISHPPRHGSLQIGRLAGCAESASYKQRKKDNRNEDDNRDNHERRFPVFHLVVGILV